MAFERKRVPVHGVHCRRGGGHYFRRPQTTQERRYSIAIGDEPSPRAARSGRNIPNSWDDYAIGRERTWKTHGKRRRMKGWDR